MLDGLVPVGLGGHCNGHGEIRLNVHVDVATLRARMKGVAGVVVGRVEADGLVGSGSPIENSLLGGCGASQNGRKQQDENKCSSHSKNSI